MSNNDPFGWNTPPTSDIEQWHWDQRQAAGALALMIFHSSPSGPEEPQERAEWATACVSRLLAKNLAVGEHPTSRGDAWEYNRNFEIAGGAADIFVKAAGGPDAHHAWEERVDWALECANHVAEHTNRVRPRL